jgi:hypothetical protein
MVPMESSYVNRAAVSENTKSAPRAIATVA